MLAEERQRAIVQLVERQGSATVAELTALLGASEATVRRDLAALDDAGALCRVHGGATVKNRRYLMGEYDSDTKREMARNEKQRIAQYAATLIEKDDFVYIDGGTTTECMVSCVQQRQATYVTNGLPHARILGERGFSVILLGGHYKVRTEVIVGSGALESMARFHFTKGFFGANGIADPEGFTTSEMDESLTKAEAFRRTRTPYILSDSSKFGIVASMSFAKLEDGIILTTRLPEGSGKFGRVVEVDKL